MRRKPADGGRRRSTGRGQALVELALVLPVMLMLFVAAIDLARAYQAWLNLQAATRNAAEYAATYAQDTTGAQTDARRIVCLAMAAVDGYVAGGTPQTCAAPSVTVSTFTRSYTAPGALNFSPIATATVQSSMTFRTVLPYPFITNGGIVTLIANETYEVAQSR